MHSDLFRGSGWRSSDLKMQLERVPHDDKAWHCKSCASLRSVCVCVCVSVEEKLQTDRSTRLQQNRAQTRQTFPYVTVEEATGEQGNVGLHHTGPILSTNSLLSAQVWLWLSVQAARPPVNLSLIWTQQWFAALRTSSPSHVANSALFVQKVTKPSRSRRLDSGNNCAYLWYSVKDGFFEFVQVSLED